MNRWVKHLLLVCVCGVGSLAACDSGGDGNPNVITINITSPATESYVGGRLEVTFEVTGEVSWVRLYSGETLLGESTAAPFTITLNTDDVQEGLHRLHAEAGGPGESLGISSEVMVVVDRTLPEAEFTSLVIPYVFTGQAEIAVGASDDNEVAEVTLLIDGELFDTCTATPCTFDWDTTAEADGGYELSAEVTDLAGNVQTISRTVAVVNNGTVISFSDGAGTGLFSIPANYASVEYDKKLHFDMPAQTTEVMAIMQWVDVDWELRADLGTGWCPDSGISYVSETSLDGQVVLNYTASEHGVAEFAVEEWFFHLGVSPAFDLDAHIDMGTYYGMTVVAY